MTSSASAFGIRPGLRGRPLTVDESGCPRRRAGSSRLDDCVGLCRRAGHRSTPSPAPGTTRRCVSASACDPGMVRERIQQGTDRARSRCHRRAVRTHRCQQLDEQAAQARHDLPTADAKWGRTPEPSAVPKTVSATASSDSRGHAETHRQPALVAVARCAESSTATARPLVSTKQSSSSTERRQPGNPPGSDTRRLA